MMYFRKASSKMETRDGRSVAKNDSFEQTEPAGPEYSNITEARENMLCYLQYFT